MKTAIIIFVISALLSSIKVEVYSIKDYENWYVIKFVSLITMIISFISIIVMW